MKSIRSSFLFAIVLAAVLVSPIGPTGCSGGPKVSETSVYAGDNFLFQVEKISVQAHDLFLEFYRWEKDNRTVLPVSVSRAADFARSNEKKWADTLNAAHDAYVATPSAQNKDKVQLALNLLKTGLNQAAFYMVANKSVAPNSGLDKANGETFKALGIEPKL